MLVADASRLCTIVVAFRNIFHETTYLKGGKGRKKKKNKKENQKEKEIEFLIIH